MVGNCHAVTIEIVVPMHTEQVARVGRIVVDTFGDAFGNAMGLGKFSKSGQNNLLLGKALDTVLKRSLIEHTVG